MSHRYPQHLLYTYHLPTVNKGKELSAITSSEIMDSFTSPVRHGDDIIFLHKMLIRSPRLQPVIS